MSDLIRREDAIDALKKYEELESDNFTDTSPIIMMTVATIANCIEEIVNLPSAEPGQSRKFLEIVVEYHELCTYPEYEGKPYYAIKYEEKGEIIIGFGTYKPEVLSQYLREYFLPSAEPERKTGKWLYKPNEYDDDTYECSQCGEPGTLIDGTPEENNMKFCPNCGADMRGE